MKDKTQDLGLIYVASFVFCLASFVFLAAMSYAQGGSEEKDKITDLPPVKIEVVDTTQLDIPKEKFQSFTKPDPGVYAPLDPKERPWYLPATSIPEKIREVKSELEKDFLFSLTAQYGIPTALKYQMFLARGFGQSEAMLDMGRWTLRSERTPELVSDPSKGLDDFNIDRLKGAFAHQGENTSFRADVQYNAKDLGYLDENGEVYPNDRALTGLSVCWGQKLSSSVRSSLSIDVSSLRMGGPLSSGNDKGLDLSTDFGIKALWPRSNPIDAGLGIGYFVGESEVEDFKEAILRLYFRDNYIRIRPFALGIGMELVLDARSSSSEDGNWDPNIYPNPWLLLTSNIGARTVLQFGLEGYISRQDLKSLYLDKDYLRFNPDLNVERTWELNGSLQYRLTRKFNVTVSGFGKHISDLTIFRKTDDGILSWMPGPREDSANIPGLTAGWELSLMDDKIKQSFEYTHEFHDGKEHIPYRPEDIGCLTITCVAPFGLELSLSGEFYGTRYVDTENDESLSSYFLWRPRISKTFSKYASVFLEAEFYIGRDDYQIWENYGLPTQIVDFGLTLRF